MAPFAHNADALANTARARIKRPYAPEENP
jgi:hypothetical protein